MSASPEVVVVGAGAAGLSCAMTCAERGAAVTIIDKDHPGSASSGLSAGIFNRQTPDPIELALRSSSVELFDELATSEALGLKRPGYIRLASTQEHLSSFAETIAKQRALGVDDSRVIDREELAELVPVLDHDRFVGGLYGASDGTLDGHLLCGAYLDRAAAAGAQLRPRHELIDARRDRGRWTLSTTKGDLGADVVVNAAGAWADRVGAILGAPAPIVAQRHQLCVVHVDEDFVPPMPVVNEYVPGSSDVALVWRPEGPRSLLVGLHAHGIVQDEAEDPDEYARGVSLDYVETIAERITELLPGLANPRLEAGWAGLYPVSPDGRFQIGPDPSAEGVVTSAGYGGVGLTVSAAAGQLCADWVLGSEPSFDFATELLPGRPGLLES